MVILIIYSVFMYEYQNLYYLGTCILLLLLFLVPMLTYFFKLISHALSILSYSDKKKIKNLPKININKREYLSRRNKILLLLVKIYNYFCVKRLLKWHTLHLKVVHSFCFCPWEVWVAYSTVMPRGELSLAVSHVSRVVCWSSPLLQGLFSRHFTP
jgi:hypothetical protein